MSRRQLGSGAKALDVSEAFEELPDVLVVRGRGSRPSGGSFFDNA